MPVKGLLAKKIGTTEIFREGGEAVCVTAVQAGPCTVTQVKTAESDGYEGVQLGFDEVRNLDNPRKGHLSKAGEKLFRYLREVEAEEIDGVEVGQEIDTTIFEVGDRVDATGLTKGRGFQGGVKRHGFHGGPKTHGQSDRHRAPGSIGAGSTPGRVIKGMRMAGHMGDVRRTIRNLEVVEADRERNILFIKGAVPGAHNSLIVIRKSR